MKKEQLSNFIFGLTRKVTDHAPELLTATAVVGLISAGVLAVTATPKALLLMEDAKEDLEVDQLTCKETVQTVWKCYIPSVALAGASVACIIMSNRVSSRRSAALATAYSFTETALKEYQDKVTSLLGEKKNLAVKDAIAKDHMESSPMATREIIITEKGNTICYDSLSGRYFKSDIEKIKQVINDLNRTMIDEMYISLNELYVSLGLESISIGEDLGWHIDKGYIDVHFSSQLTSEGTPCLVMEFAVQPRSLRY